MRETERFARRLPPGLRGVVPNDAWPVLARACRARCPTAGVLAACDAGDAAALMRALLRAEGEPGCPDYITDGEGNKSVPIDDLASAAAWLAKTHHNKGRNDEHAAAALATLGRAEVERRLEPGRVVRLRDE